MLPFITLFGYRLPSYGICFSAGMALAVVTAVLLSKKRDIQRYDVVYAAVIAGIGGLIGAKLLFILINLPLIIGGQITLYDAFQGGFVFYGGLIGGMLGLFIYVKGYKLDVAEFFDLFATAVPLGHAVGRIGCFLGGCCYGMEYDGPLHCVYTQNIGNTPVGVPLLPIQLIEAALLLCLFVGMLILYNRKPQKGIQTAVYGLVYSIMRFILEFFRGDAERGGLFGISTSQIISLLLAVAMLGRLAKLRKEKTVN